MAIVKKMTKRGFTLIELMIVVVIIGVLAALAIYGVQKYVANSKSAEARMMLGRMTKDHVSFFEGETQAAAILDFGESATISRALCPAAVVTSPNPPAAAKAMPTAGVFDTIGWQCLGTSINTPVYYQYSMTSDQAGATLSTLTEAAAGDAFTAIATGDLDGDTNPSTFSLGGQVIAAADGSTQLTLATTVTETNPEE